jgi:hypothetical protein
MNNEFAVDCELPMQLEGVVETIKINARQLQHKGQRAYDYKDRSCSNRRNMEIIESR